MIVLVVCFPADNNSLGKVNPGNSLATHVKYIHCSQNTQHNVNMHCIRPAVCKKRNEVLQILVANTYECNPTYWYIVPYVHSTRAHRNYELINLY